ncbi:MFS transporter [Streptacidiphilus sp. PB12-B1b]|uniref:peptide MFS transporter n=1 Tax=Streptacidiphilus sp. PB12-B1b TaxID=2705012 RepID=UPI0015FA9C9F|nr:oligopeptide:H+ symporter [Streptacidiphilus sp. PB12-B1b]QMU77128.1 MFS transporter [Streptacidiphilus sp. PB12-B1b]
MPPTQTLPVDPELTPQLRAVHGRTFFGHPRGLATLFLTEMWERFSFYGMRSLLVLYLVAPVSDGGLGFGTATAAAVYSVYNAMVYLLTLPGGWVSDRLWGAHRTVLVGGCTIMAGHFLLAVPGEGWFFAGLGLVAVGSGLLKANISTMVGHLYPDRNDPRRDGGFTVFYMGINLGAFAAPLVVGTVGQRVDWRLGFALAGLGMALGLVQYLLGGRRLSRASRVVGAPLPPAERAAVLRRAARWTALAVAFYAVVVGSGHYTIAWVIRPLTVVGLVVPALVLLRMKRDKELDAEERHRLSGYVYFFLAAAVFWMIYDQSGSTLTVFATEDTRTRLFGLGFPSSWFQSLNPLLVMALAPVAAWLWVRLARRGRNPGTAAKFGCGLLLIGLSFGVMMLAMAAASGGARVSPLWLAAVYLVQTVGELALSPVGLSVTTKLAPVKYAGQMMGVWFLASTVGDSLAAVLQQLVGSAFLSTVSFALQGVLALLVGAAVLVNRWRITGLLGGVR